MMGRTNALVGNSAVQVNATEGESEREGHTSAARDSVAFSVEREQSLKARYVYGFIFLKTNLFAWFVRDYGYTVLKGVWHIAACKREDSNCYHKGGVLRASFGCFIFFLLMSITTFGARKLQGARNIWHCRWWALKFALYLISMMVSFIIPSDFILMYGEVARIGAGIFLLFQLVSVLRFITWCDNYWMPDLRAGQCGFAGLFFSTLFNIATFCGICLMYLAYAPDSSCILNIFLITWTAFLAKVMMVVSLHPKVNRGLLSSAIMGSYIVFLCWSTIQSEPPIEKCNRRKETVEHVNGTTILGFFFAIGVIVMTTFSTGTDSKAFQFRKAENESEDDTPYRYDLFHFIFSIGAMHFAMLFINWELDHSTKKWSIDVGWASTWVKIINGWFAASFYLWKLISPVLSSSKILDHEVPVSTSGESV